MQHGGLWEFEVRRAQRAAPMPAATRRRTDMIVRSRGLPLDFTRDRQAARQRSGLRPAWFDSTRTTRVASAIGVALESEMPNRLVLVMSAASELKVRDIRRPSFRKRNDVMELEEACLFAATPRANECASALVPFPHGAFHTSRNVAAALTSG